MTIIEEKKRSRSLPVSRFYGTLINAITIATQTDFKIYMSEFMTYLSHKRDIKGLLFLFPYLE